MNLRAIETRSLNPLRKTSRLNFKAQNIFLKINCTAKYFKKKKKIT